MLQKINLLSPFSMVYLQTGLGMSTSIKLLKSGVCLTPKAAMRPKDYALPTIVALLIYIAYGSAIPGPVGSFSQTLRSGANHFFSSIFSGFATYNPYNRSEKAVEELQKK